MNLNKLFKIDNENKIHEDIKRIELEGKENSEVRDIVIKNFKKFFPHLELFDEGKQFALPHGFRGKKIPDSLAFCESEERMWIFEYKSKIDEEMIEQVKKYRNSLTNIDNLILLQNKWNEKNGKFLDLNILKKEAKIICVSPQFDNYAIGIEEEEKEEIFLVKLNKYQTKNKEELILLQSKNDWIIKQKNKEVNDYREKEWNSALEKWMDNKIIPLVKKHPHLTLKLNFGKDRHKIYDIKKGSTTFDILYKNPWDKNKWLTNPKIFLVNPNDKIKNKYKLVKSLRHPNSYEYIIDTKNNSFQEAYLLITEFIKEKN